MASRPEWAYKFNADVRKCVAGMMAGGSKFDLGDYPGALDRVEGAADEMKASVAEFRKTISASPKVVRERAARAMRSAA